MADKVIEDRSGHGNHGRLTGAHWVPTKCGPVLDFDGTADSIVICEAKEP